MARKLLNKIMSLVILTKSPVFNYVDLRNQFKSFIKCIFGQQRGPNAVVGSLRKGLKESNLNYKYNLKANDIVAEDIVYINGSVEALKWAIEAKKKGRIKKLIVGPVMSVLPSDHDSIMMADEIDLILFPSQWTKNHWLFYRKDLEKKIYIWPVGVDVPEMVVGNRNLFLVYYKKAPDELLKYIILFLDKSKINYRIVKYGKYNQKKYFSSLKKAKMAIFLSESESQGLAMFEAWAHDVPTIVWNRGYWQMGEHKWEDEKISSPYLADDCGMFFSNQNDFEEKFRVCLEKISTFRPREYIINNFTNKKIEENFIRIINE